MCRCTLPTYDVSSLKAPSSAEWKQHLGFVLLVLILLVHTILLAWSAWTHTPVASEMAHLAAGVSHLQLNRFDLMPVNPPLVRVVAALPVVLASPETDWGRYDPDPLSRSEHAVGRDFLNVNGERAFWLLTLARWACIPFALIGASVCYCWARALYGSCSGLLAATTWCFSPYILGHASLMIPDAHAAALGIAACYVFWLWLQRPNWVKACAAGIALGIAALAKSTLLFLYPALLSAWAVYRFCISTTVRSQSLTRDTPMLTTLTLLSVLVINLGYGFEGSFGRLDSYRFHSGILSGVKLWEKAVGEGGNRFAGTWLGSLPVPVPRNYMKGIDKQKSDFDHKQPSFLGGKWKTGGWWYYYLYALAIKLPLGTLGLMLLAVLVGMFGRGYCACWRDEVFLLTPAITILMVVSSQTGFNHHSRYVLPVLPFLFVWLSKVARAGPRRNWWLAAAAGVCLAWSVSSSLWVYPHSFSYFNELVGGPTNGHNHLSQSNIAWGQDLFYLRWWLERRPDIRSLYLSDVAYFDPRVIQIEWQEVPVGPSGVNASSAALSRLGPLPGWYAVNVCQLHRNPDSYAYLQRFRPMEMIAYSLHIYHISLDEANRVRRELGLPELPADWQSTRRDSDG